jgi:glycosyltransferase involved in cell wall biosynthesis
MTGTRVVMMANNIDEVGGAQRVVHVVAHGLAERGYAVDLVGVTPFEPRHEFVAAPAFRRFVLMSEEWPPPPVPGLRNRFRSKNRRRRETRSRLTAQAVSRLAEVLADGPAGVVVTSQLWAMEHLVEVPHDDWAVVGQYHSSFEAAATGRDLVRALTLYKDVDLFTLLTESDAEAFRRRGLDNTTALANPLAFWPREPVVPGPGPDRVVTYLGRLSAEKGVRFLVEAWGLVADRFPTWRLRLVGSGPDESAVRRAIAALPTGSDRVELLPPVLDAEATLGESDLIVLPSLTEGLPLVLAEAMACGLPCIATDCSAGVRLLSEDGQSAHLVPRADAGALAGAMGDLMANEPRRSALGRRARIAMDGYRAEAILDQWERMLSDVLR